jgi:hypothetical protein
MAIHFRDINGLLHMGIASSVAKPIPNASSIQEVRKAASRALLVAPGVRQRTLKDSLSDSVAAIYFDFAR